MNLLLLIEHNLYFVFSCELNLGVVPGEFIVCNRVRTEDAAAFTYKSILWVSSEYCQYLTDI